MNPSRPHNSLAASLLAAVVGMSLLAYAAVPLYSLFCKVTGYGGTISQNKVAPVNKGSRKIKITFDSNIHKDLPWMFRAVQKHIEVLTGEVAIIFYYAENISKVPVIGTAVYNVTPHKAGRYFNKIECFCFKEQLLGPKQQAMLPVSFFIDPALEADPNLNEVNEITLSYSFFATQ